MIVKEGKRNTDSAVYILPNIKKNSQSNFLQTQGQIYRRVLTKNEESVNDDIDSEEKSTAPNEENHKEHELIIENSPTAPNS